MVSSRCPIFSADALPAALSHGDDQRPSSVTKSAPRRAVGAMPLRSLCESPASVCLASDAAWLSGYTGPWPWCAPLITQQLDTQQQDAVGQGAGVPPREEGWWAWRGGA